MARLTFLDKGYLHAPIRHLEGFEHHDVPERAGAYVLLAGPGTMFPYPRRRSSVFCIGKAKNLRARHLTHVRCTLEARSDRQLTLYYAMYEFGAAFGCRYTFVVAEPRERLLRLESNLLEMF